MRWVRFSVRRSAAWYSPCARLMATYAGSAVIRCFRMDELHTGHVASAEDHHLRPVWSASVKVVVAVRDALDDGTLADDVRVGRAANQWVSDDQFLSDRVGGQHGRGVSEISSDEVRIGPHPGGTLSGRAGPSAFGPWRFTACSRQGSDFGE